LNQAKWAKRWDFAYNTPLTLTWFKPNMRPTAALANVGTKQAALAKGISHSSGASISLVPDNVTETIYPTSTSFVKLKPN